MYLDTKLSPDPTLGRAPDALEGGWAIHRLYPHALAWTSEPQPELDAWAAKLHLHRAPGPLVFSVPIGRDADFVLDFGTELEGALWLDVEAGDAGQLAVSFGESLWEAREWGLPSTCVDQRPRKQVRRITGRGSHRLKFESGGFRFVRLRWVDFCTPIRLGAVGVEARFHPAAACGAFICDDAVFQRIWWSAAYTARLCTRLDTIWDGPKRDRHGWFGDARITQRAWNRLYADPRPPLAMLHTLPTDGWANGIPNYSFDAVAMLREHLLYHGAAPVPEVSDLWRRIQAFMTWVRDTQTGPEGLLLRRDGMAYFFDIGFCDWTPQPLGGRFEDLSWLQFAWLECLQDAAICARMLGDVSAAVSYATAASHLRPILRARFRAPGGGFHHTLALAEPPQVCWRMPVESGVHHRLSYLESRNHGPSGPSLHALARAVWAGAVEPEEAAEIRAAFRRPELSAIITSYYWYYTTHARAAVGDREAALLDLRGYYREMLDGTDSACIWESFEPEVEGVERWSLNAWPKSLCHGWGSGPVPLTEAHLLGISPVGPAWSRVALACPSRLPWAFAASIPTPNGPIQIEHSAPGDHIALRLPPSVTIEGPMPAGVTLA